MFGCARPALVLRVLQDEFPVVETHAAERQVTEIPHRMGLTCGKHVIVSNRGLQHQPQCPYVVASEPPVPARLQITKLQLVVETSMDTCYRPRDLARNELGPASRTLMVK